MIFLYYKHREELTMNEIIQTKIKKPQFTMYGCGNLNEFNMAKDLTEHMLTIAKNSAKVLITIKQLTKNIKEYGEKFMVNAPNTEDQQELYNQFVGDYFEAFAEYFFKECSNKGQYGIIDYKSSVNNKDWGVDGYGICANQNDALGGSTPAVVQIKFRSNPMSEIEYTMLAKTGWDGVKNYGLDINRKNNVILFCNTEKGANYLAQQAMQDNLLVIDMRDLDKDITGIKTVKFWEDFLKEFV